MAFLRQPQVFLITGKSVPLPTAIAEIGEGGEIVRTQSKDREYVNPLVPGSSPGGPTNFSKVRLVRLGRVFFSQAQPA